MAKSRHTIGNFLVRGRPLKGKMKYFKILPAAASVIALTSVTCFAQDQREFEESVTTVKRVRVHSPSGKDAENLMAVQPEMKSGGIYLIEVELGSSTKEVLIDARNGAILRKRDITVSVA
jgi:hypothetical protein